jgi:hypothetical protein
MFCPKCGSNMANNRKFCTNCGENLEKAIFLLKEAPRISDVSESESIIELSLEDDVESLPAFLNTPKKFNLKVKNNSKNHIYDIEVILSGPPQVQIILQSRFFPILRATATNFIPLIILPRTSGTFTLTAKLSSNMGLTITMPIELRVVVPTSTGSRKIKEEKYLSKVSPGTSDISKSDSVIELRTLAPTSKENMKIQETKYLLKEAPRITDISESDSVVKLSLEREVESLIVLPNTHIKFNLKVKNNSNSSLNDIEVILSGPPQVELILQSRFFPIIRAMATNFIPLVILPRTSGTFTLTAKLHSNIGLTITLPIELRIEAPTNIERGDVSVQSIQKTPAFIPRPSVRKNQRIAVSGIFALIGVICMLSGVGSILTAISTGYVPGGATTVITLLIIGLIFLFIGLTGATRGKCCICACGT